MPIKEAKFVTSSFKSSQCPKETFPEYAFIGRSNVGKSSLINMLCNQKHLAKISGRPGKTQLINHFLINKSWFLVDLPGYGYAKVSKTQHAKFSKIITDYLSTRTKLQCLFVLIDSRLEPQKIDLEFLRSLGISGTPFAIIFTKMDKLNKTQTESNINHYKETLLEEWEELPQLFFTSSTKRTGDEELIDYIENINANINT